MIANLSTFQACAIGKFRKLLFHQKISKMDLSSILLAADAADALQSPPPMLTIINCALAIRRESAAISTGNKKQTPSDRELAHVRSEQKRRNNISDGFYDLRQSIPFCDGVVDSKSSTLRKGKKNLKGILTYN